MPASTKSWLRISAAAIRLPTKPVSEIAFGVRRDSIRRLRATARISAAVSDPLRPLPPRSRAGALLEPVAHAVTLAVRQAQASGRTRAKAYEAADADAAATSAPSAASIQKWLAVAITTNVTSAG